MRHVSSDNNQNLEAFQSLKAILTPAITEDVQNLDNFVEKILVNGPLSIYNAKQHFQDFEEIYQKIIEDEKYQTYRKQTQTNLDEPSNLAHILPDPKSVNHFFSANYLPTLQTKEFIYSLSQDKNNTPDNLPALFGSLIPLILDLLGRREDLFHGFILVLHQLDCEFGTPFEKLVSQLEVKDLLAFLLESCPPFFISKLHMCLMNSFYPFPLVYPLRKGQYQSNLSLCSHLMFQVNKPLILSVGTKSTQNLGMSSLLFEIFGTQEPSLFSTINGLTHSGSIDLYLRIPNEKNQYLIADVHSLKDDEDIEEFSNMISEVASISQLIIIHFTEKDVKIQDDSKYYIDTTLSISSEKQAKQVLYLFRDYDNTNKQTLQNLQESLKDTIGIIPIPKLNSVQNAPATISMKKKMIQEILQKIKDFSMTSQDALFQNQLKEIQKYFISPPIPTEKLFSSLALDCKILQTEKSYQKVSMLLHGCLSDEQKQENNVKMQEIQNKLLHLKNKKSNSKLNALLESILQVISKPDSLQHFQLKQIIQNFKKESSLALQHFQDLDIHLPAFIDDAINFFEPNHKGETFSQQYQGLKRYLQYCLKHNNPVGLLNGITLKYGSKLLKEVLDDENDKEKVFVISIIGEQNSAKSTLLNALFGSAFTVASGRCTRGLDFTLLHHPSGFKIIVIDTEGLLSIQARDHEFDNLITTMIFSCSHIVIVNTKGELNRLHKNLIELCCFAMQYLKLNDEIRPKLIFALRDVADYDNQQPQKEAFNHLKQRLEETAQRDLIDINDILDFDEKDLFLLPSAFIHQSQSNANTLGNATFFASQVMKMRSYISEYLQNKTPCAMPSLHYFYDHTTHLWETLTKIGKKIMQAKTVDEFELMNEAFEIVIEISRTYSQIFLTKGNELLNLFKSQELDEKYNFKDPLLNLFMETKSLAFQNLDEKIIKNVKYRDISSEFHELKNLLQFKLKAQKQLLKNEWKSYIFEKKYQLKLKKSKNEIKSAINATIRNSDLNNVEFKVNSIFQTLKRKLEKKFEKNRKVLENYIARLPQEIYNNFQYLIQQANKNNHSTKIITLSYQDFLSKLQSGQAENPPLDSLFKFSIKNPHQNIKEALEIIESYFRSFLDKIDGIIHSKITEESINNSISLCLSTINEMERKNIPVNSALFLANGMNAAMYKQQKKIEQAELQELEKKRQEFSQVHAEEENFVTELLKESQDLIGEKSAVRWWRQIQEEFIEQESFQIEMSISAKLNQKSMGPETLLKKAYSHSFQKKNFENVVKYILDLNKFAKETYSKIVNKLINTELTENISQQLSQHFNQIIQSLIGALEEWKDQEKSPQKVQLGSLLPHIENASNKSLRKYFPDLYITEIYNLEYFVYGCVKQLKSLLEKNLEGEFRSLLLKKFKRVFKRQPTNLEGCQMRCDTCHGKCQIPGSSHQTHFTNCQLILAFHGKYEDATKNAILASCFQTMNDKEVNEISIEQKECWVGTKDFFIKYYGYQDNTPQDWLDLVKPEERLKDDIVIPGYSQK